MRIQRKRIDRVIIRCASSEEENAVKYLDEHGYDIISRNCPLAKWQIGQRFPRLDISRLVIVAERELEE